MTESVTWLSTKDACERLGITVRTLYRFIDEGRLTAYQMGRVIRIQEGDLDAFVEGARIAPGTLSHLYPDTGHVDGDHAAHDLDDDRDADDEPSPTDVDPSERA